MEDNPRDLSKYKSTLSKLKITHLSVADYIGHTREQTTLWLNGKNPPMKIAKHISKEIEELIQKNSHSKSKPNYPNWTTLNKMQKEIKKISDMLEIIKDSLGDGVKVS
jgi:hypothetical protein